MKIIILDRATLGNIPLPTELEDIGEIISFDTTSAEETAKNIGDAEIVLTNKVIIDKAVIDNCPSLKFIGVLATGTNNIDIPYAESKGITVNNVAGYSTNSVAQHTFTMLFYLIGQPMYFDYYTGTGAYTKSDTFTHLGKSYWELSGKTVGIIGLGNIGTKVAQIATAFGANVQYYSTSGQNNKQPYTQVDLETLLQTSDVVSIHAPMTDKNYHLIGENELKLMKPSAILLNNGRGGIVEENALANALNNDVIGAAGLDVLEQEPMTSNNPLLSVNDKSKLFITPHIAWASVEARTELLRLTVENLRKFKARN